MSGNYEKKVLAYLQAPFVYKEKRSQPCLRSYFIFYSNTGGRGRTGTPEGTRF